MRADDFYSSRPPVHPIKTSQAWWGNRFDRSIRTAISDLQFCTSPEGNFGTSSGHPFMDKGLVLRIE
jgi:hypothetical protein